MSADELRAELPDIVAVLTALGGVLPGRVDPELLGFLERASVAGVEAELLHFALSGGQKVAGKFKVR